MTIYSTIFDPDKNIVLIGFMGVGKTTIGQILASKLNREFIDIDQEIKNQFQMQIPQIFQQFGETKFREAERNIIKDFCNNTKRHIISLGGGAYLQDEVREICLATSIVVYLDLPFQIWQERLGSIMEGRPLLKDKTIQEIEELFQLRQKTYVLNHLTVNTSTMDPEQAAQSIIRSLKLK